MDTTDKPGRPPRERTSVREYILKKILKGSWPPGARIPPQRELMRMIRSNSVTLHRALTELKEDGFIVPRGRHGTFVASPLPLSARIGIVIPADRLPLKKASLFDESLKAACAEISEPNVSEFVIYENVAVSENCASFRQLLNDISRKRIGSLIIEDCYLFWNTPVMTDPSIVRVGIGGSEVVKDLLNFSVIHMDHESIADLAVSVCRQNGKSRPAVLVSAPVYCQISSTLERVLQQFGMNIRSAYVHILPPAIDEAVYNCVRLLFSQPASRRPDALIVLDDNLLPPACEAITQTNMQSSHPFFIVSHSNFPLSREVPLPVHRIGFDMRHLLLTCLDLIRRRQGGASTPSITAIKPSWADAVRARDPAARLCREMSSRQTRMKEVRS